MFSLNLTPPDRYLVILAQHIKSLAAKYQGLSASDFSGPPLTRFICEACEAITEFDGVLECPNSVCPRCGGEFHKIGDEFVRNAVMQPHVVRKEKPRPSSKFSWPKTGS